MRRIHFFGNFGDSICLMYRLTAVDQTDLVWIDINPKDFCSRTEAKCKESGKPT